MNKSRLIGAFYAVLFTFNTVSANAALVSRLGGQAAYDDVLDITWVTNAALSGPGSWGDIVGWAEQLDYLGFDDWRLATVSVASLPTGTTDSVIDCSSTTEMACRDNELGYMFYQNMGGSFGDDKTGDQLVDGVQLTDVQNLYWSSVERFYSSSGVAWGHVFNGGWSGADVDDEFVFMNGWAVRSGDVGPVPIPAALWLFGSGLLGLIGMARRKKAA